MQQIQKEQEYRKKQIPGIYGPLFTDIVGVDTICKLPEVKAETLNLHRECKYPRDRATPSMMRAQSAVRGILNGCRPFVAIKIEAKELTTNKTVGVFVEVIFKRYGLDGDGGPGRLCEDNYVTALSNSTDTGFSHPSFLYGSGGMSLKQVEVVKKLLSGEEVTDPQTGLYKLKMV